MLLVSPELDEIIALSDRIAVMYKGQIVGILPAARINKAYLGLLMAGVKPSEALETTPAPYRKPKWNAFKEDFNLNANATPTNPERTKSSGKQSQGSKLLQTLLVPALAVLTGFIIGAIVIALSNDAVIVAYRNFFHAPGAALAATWKLLPSRMVHFFMDPLAVFLKSTEVSRVILQPATARLSYRQFIHSLRAWLLLPPTSWLAWRWRWDSSVAFSISERKGNSGLER